MADGQIAVNPRTGERVVLRGGQWVPAPAAAPPTAAIPYPTSRQIGDNENTSQTGFRDTVQAPNVIANTAETQVDIERKRMDIDDVLRKRARGFITDDSFAQASRGRLQAIRDARDNVNAFSTGTIGELIGDRAVAGVEGSGGGLAGLPIVGGAIYGDTDRARLNTNLATIRSGAKFNMIDILKERAAASGGQGTGLGQTAIPEFTALGQYNFNLEDLSGGSDTVLNELSKAEEAELRRYAALTLPTDALVNATPAERKALLDRAYEQAKREYANGFQPVSEDDQGVLAAPTGGGTGGTGGGAGGPQLGPIGGALIRSDEITGTNPAIAKGDVRYRANPAMAEVNTSVRQMVREGVASGDIVKFMESRGVPVTPDVVAAVQSNVEFYRPYVGRALPPTVPEPQANLEQIAEPTTFGERTAGVLADTRLGTFATQFADGVSLGSLDEIAGAVSDDPQRQAEIEFLKRYQRETYPGAALTGQLSGTVTTFLPAGRLASTGARAVGLGARGQAAAVTATDVGLGTAEGALSNNEDRKTGAVTGGLFSLAGDLLGRSIGGRGVSAANTPTAAERTVADAVSDPDRVRGVLTEAERVGSPVALADTSPALRNLAGASVRRSDEAGVLADGTVGARDLAQATRAVETVERTLAKETNVPKAAKTMRQQGQAAADPSYKAAYGRVGVAQDAEIKAILQRPDVQEGLKLAERAIANRGRDAKELGFSVGKNGRVTIRENATFEALDLAKRGIDDHLDTFRDDFGRLVTNDQTRAIIDAREALVGRMRTLNPDYGAALDTYAPFARNAEALEMGGKAITNGKATPAQIAEIVGGMDDAARANYQIGAANAIIDRVKKSKDNTDAFSVFRSEDMRQRLAAVFPDKADQLANVNSITQMEGLMRRTKEALLGGSATAGRQVADEAFGAKASVLGPLAEGGVSFATGGASTVLQSLVRLGTMSGRNAQRLAAVRDQEALARDLAPVLLETDPAKARKALDRILGRVDDYNKTRTRYRQDGASVGAATAAGVLNE
jgi:hypothetical protein